MIVHLTGTVEEVHGWTPIILSKVSHG